MPGTALLFSGYNQRAIVALCRGLTAAEQDFAIVAAGPDDSIHRTDYAAKVLFTRESRALTVELFARAARSLAGPVVYCPASEFLNFFVLDHADELEALGVDVGLPARGVYERVTGKRSSQSIVSGVPGVLVPEDMDLDTARAPCILKPRENVIGGRVLYPIICSTADELAGALGEIDAAEWFAQRFVVGQSFYLCAYLERSGRFAGYWQENLMQQPGGKSIVLARSCENPGLDETAILSAFRHTGYRGPLMLEFIREGGACYYIETNPRFWGPLQLGLDCSHVIALYLEERFDGPPPPAAGMSYAVGRYYAWQHGARVPGAKRYPAAAGLDVDRLLEEHDVFAAADTRALHGAF